MTRRLLAVTTTIAVLVACAPAEAGITAVFGALRPVATGPTAPVSEPAICPVEGAAPIGLVAVGAAASANAAVEI